MIYRNDVEALEARYRALEAELAEKRVARDEAARMLAEARARADHERMMIEHAIHRPRRRRRAVFGGAMTVLTLLGVAIGYRAATHRPASGLEQVLDRISAFADLMCACRDSACANKVTEELSRWGQSLAHEPGMDAVPDQEQLKLAQAASERLSRCMVKAMSIQPTPPATPEAQPVEAPLPEARQ